MKIKKRIRYYINEIEKIAKFKFDKNRLRKIPYITDYGYVYDEQVLASLEVIYHMVLAKNDPTHSRYNMLVAEPQVGKTGVIGNIKFLLEHYNDLRNYLELDFGSSRLGTSMSDIANIGQIGNDLNAQSNSRADKKSLFMSDYDGVMHNPNLLTQQRKNPNEKVENGIVVIDEAHLASFKESVNNKYLQSRDININGLGDLNKNNMTLITISATPYEELVGNKIYNSPKNIIYINPGKGYRGIKWFYENDKIRQSFILSTLDGIHKFHDELRKFNHKPGYYIVRIDRNTNYKKLVPEGFAKPITYFQENQIDINNILRKKPDKPTLVFIKEKMKQSFQLEKSNIVMLFDRTTIQNSEDRTHFIVQSLLGRACGYHDYDFMIYTDINNVHHHLNYMADSNNIPKTKRTAKRIFDGASSKLIKLDFNDDKNLFEEILSLEPKKYDDIRKIEIAKIIYSKYKVDILKKYYNSEAIYNSNFYYSKKKSTYDNYITKAYYDIEAYDGYSKIDFIYDEEQYSKNKESKDDCVFAVYIDEENYNIIIAEKIPINSSEKIYKYGLSDKSCFNRNNEIDCTVDNLRDVDSIPKIGFLDVNGDKIEIYINRRNELVLPKKTKVEKKFIENYIEDNIVVKDIKISYDGEEQLINTLDFLSKIISIDKTYQDFKCENGTDFMELLKMRCE